MWPQTVLFKTASGALIESKLGLVRAYTVQGKDHWGTTYEPDELTPADEAMLAHYKMEYRALNRRFDAFKKRAYARGKAVALATARQITDARERRA